MTQQLVTRIERGQAAERILMLVHGLGSDENDLAGILPYLDPDGRFVTVLPRGPYANPPGFAWFPIGQIGRDQDAFVTALDALDATLDAASAEHGLARDEAIVAGFSQGAAMATALVYRAEVAEAAARPRPAGAIAMSGFLPETAAVPLAVGDHLPPALVQHGLYDPMVPAHRGRKLAQMLAARGAPVVYREYPMQHQVTLESIEEARAWLGEVLDGKRPSTEGAP